MNGIVNEQLLPMVPIKIRKKDGEWQELSLLLDTGFNGEIALDASLLGKYSLATRPDHQLRTPEKVLESDDNWKPNAPYTGKIELNGHEQTAGIQIVRQHPLNGMLGTKLLMQRRITVDIVEDGIVTIENIPPRSSKTIASGYSRIKKLEKALGVDRQNYSEWFSDYLAWTKLKVKNNSGGFNLIPVNIDTGDNTELGLPTQIVEKLGLTASGKCRANTTDGLVERDQGEAEIIWQGKKRQVKCVHLPSDNPPVIGMRLLKGNRITIDYVHRPAVEIRRIPKPTQSVRGFLDSLRNHLHS